MIKDIVVNLNVGADANRASDYAISVTAALDAHLTGGRFPLRSDRADERRLCSPRTGSDWTT